MYQNLHLKATITTVLLLLCITQVNAQDDIPDEYRGDEDIIARGVLNGNLIETNFRNHGELSRWSDIPWGVWPRTVGGRHIDGVGVIVAGYVQAASSDRIDSFDDYLEYRIWEQDYIQAEETDTILNPLIIHYRDAGRRDSPFDNLEIYGWLPLPGFNNAFRIDPVTAASAPTPALSNDETSWPDFWPDKLDAEDPGWPGTWNGRDGRFASSDLESFYVMDDYSDWEYAVGLETDGPHSDRGVFYPSPLTDPTKGGFGLQMQVRLFQWANVLAEDTMFLIYEVSNESDLTHERLFFAQIVDYGLGNEENDDNASFDDFLDVVYGWDSDGIGTPTTGGSNYDLGYTGFAFLESPGNEDNGIDDDLDGIIDESRSLESLIVYTTIPEMLAHAASANYDLDAFEQFYGEPLEERPAAKALRWYISDENLDWVGFEDANENGIWDPGELLNNDVGEDGLGEFDLNYPGRDNGQGDGRPTDREPNYNRLDVDESDQIGLTGFDLDTRPEYESGDNLRDDTWLFGKIEEHLFSNPEYVPPSTVANNEPFILFVSGEVKLESEAEVEMDMSLSSTERFSTAWIFGDNEEDFFKNRRTVQSIYNADYNFAQPPIMPTLTAVPGDGQVILSWDTLSVRSFDRFLQEFDFEGYKVYKGTNNVFTDSRTITDINGTPTFYDPIAQYDLVNGIEGPRTVFDGEAVYDLGDDTGLDFFYIDDEVTNGKTYYYAVVAYDRGVVVADSANTTGDATGLDPQENTFNITLDFTGNVVGTSPNAAVVIPTTPVAGYVAGGSQTDLSAVSSGTGTGYATVNVIVETELDESNNYRVNFRDSLSTQGDFRLTTSYSLTETNSNEVLIDYTEFSSLTSITRGFSIGFSNSDPALIIDSKTGWVSNEGTENELFDLNPAELDGLNTNWDLFVAPDDNGLVETAIFVRTDNDFELLFVDINDTSYTPDFLLGSPFTRVALPVLATNITTGEPADMFLIDSDDSNSLTGGDALFIAEPDSLGRDVFRFSISTFIDGADSPPSPGDKIRISTTRAFGSDDTFNFSVSKGRIDNDLAKSQLDSIFVAPNPYIGAASWENFSNSTGRGERAIKFFNLPEICTIRIFNVRGELIKTLEHDSMGALNEGSISWDLKTNNNEDVAYGVYFYHVEAPGIGEYVDKFAVVK